MVKTTVQTVTQAPAEPTTFRMPEVSVITSWCVRTRDLKDNLLEDLRDSPAQAEAHLDSYHLPGFDRALEEGIEVLDLYLLDHHEIPIYAAAVGLATEWRDWEKENPENSEQPPTGKFATPAAFLAYLAVRDQSHRDQSHLEKLATFLQRRLVQKFDGRGIGRRPRITGIATHFPYISLPDDSLDPEKARDKELGMTLREISVQALRAALYLAHRLGVRRVEAVCGSRVALPYSESVLTPEECYTKRLEALAQSLRQIFDSHGNLPLPAEGSPYLALELEPGPAYLLNQVKEFENVHRLLSEEPEIQKRVGLNVDLAHFFLIGLNDPKQLEPNLYPYLFHAHIADHAGDNQMGGIHASDLVPGSFHPLADYKPWLDFLCHGKAPNFSGVIAVEQEASFQAEDLTAARSVVQRWLQTCGKDIPSRKWEWAAERTQEGAFLVIDIGNSTREFLGTKAAPEQSQEEAARVLGNVIEKLCAEARLQGGSALNFTGDGLLILFEEKLQPDEAALHAFEFAQNAFEIVAAEIRRIGDEEPLSRIPIPAQSLTLRYGLHWGECYIPTTGPLRDNAIGRDVVYAARLCSWLGDTIERAAPRGQAKNGKNEELPEEQAQGGATEAFVKRYGEQAAVRFRFHSSLPGFARVIAESAGQKNDAEAERANLFREVAWQYWGLPSFKGLDPVPVYVRKAEERSV